MKPCKTLKELEDAIGASLESYKQKLLSVPDDGSIWPLATQPGGVIHYRAGDDKPDINGWLKIEAIDARNYATDIWQQNPKLSEPPKTEADSLVELNQIRQWCIGELAETKEPPIAPETTPVKFKIRPCHKRAYSQWIEARESILRAGITNVNTYKEVYRYCRDELKLEELAPTEKTWVRYISYFFNHSEEKSNPSMRSAVKVKDVDYNSSQQVDK